MKKPLIIGDLTARIPIIQGGMGVGVSLSSLAGSVAGEGGIGVLSAAQIGFKEEDFPFNALEANLRAIGKHINKAREIANDGILGMNIMVATKNYASYVKASIQAGIDIIISGAGLPLELPKLVKGTKTKIIPIVSSLRATELILKTWLRRDGALPDAVIIEGPKAGGHLGFSNEDIENKTKEEYENDIKNIITCIEEFSEKNGKDIPVITAGGIDSKESYLRQFDLGASGVQMGTKFVTTFECDAHEDYKKAYINCKEEDIVIVKSPVGMPGRAINNKFVKAVSDHKMPIKKCFSCIIPCKPDVAQYCITDALINAVQGNIDDALLFCGANTYKESKLKSVKEVLGEFS